MIETWLAVVLSSAGITLGFGAMFWRQREEFRQREDRLYADLRVSRVKIAKLETQVEILMETLRDFGIAVPRTSPTVSIVNTTSGADTSIGGDAVGHNKEMYSEQ